MAAAAKGTILVTGGVGYIGSHTTIQLVEAGYNVVIVDNLCNSKLACLERVRALSGRGEAITFVKADLLDAPALDALFTAHGPFACVIHFAALKAVGESVSNPLRYYSNNLSGTFSLLGAMTKHNCKRIVFSSSATVYGSAPSPLTEGSAVGTGITNPYGQTKYMMEQVLRDVYKSDPTWGIVLLRYFNPVGAHPSGRIGEDPAGMPNNLMPYIQQVAVGRRECLTVHGGDYATPDGTGVRDYIHVMDLAAGHIKALEWMFKAGGRGCDVFNLGTGTGYSVLDMVKAMERASGRAVKYVVGPRREGDLASVYADPAKARDVLGWTAKRGLEDMCRDAWAWQSANPTGFPDA